MALIRVARSRWNIAAGMTLAAGLGLAAFSLPAADGPKSGDAKADSKAAAPDTVRDLTDKVEITINGGLTSLNKTTHSAAVVIKSTSDEDLSGPLVVVVDETGIATLSVKDSDGMLEGDKPYVEVLDKRGTLKAGKSLRTQKIEFTTDEALTLNQRKQFSLKLRVLYLPESARTAKTGKNAKGEDLIEGKKYSEQDFARVATIQEKWTIPLLNRGEGNLYGTAVAEDKDGNLVVKVFTQREGIADQLPDNVDGIPVMNFVIGGPYRAIPPRVPGAPIFQNGIPKKPGSGLKPVPDPGPGPGSPSPLQDQPESGAPGDPTITFPRPVPIGVSIANVDRLLIALDCYAGTLACRCVDSLGNLYLLTNAHVGGEVFTILPSLINIPGERMVQTSTLDMLPIPCVPDLSKVIGVVTDFEEIELWTEQQVLTGAAVPDYMDASVSRVFPNRLQAETPDDGYGAPQRELAKVRLGDPVQKYGRTTIYTKGQITGLNVSVMVQYIPNGFGYFVRQVEYENLAGGSDIDQPNPFTTSGDSGSLVVTRTPGDPKSDRKPVALHFAGGTAGQVHSGLGSPIGPILTRFHLSIDDGSGTPAEAGPSGTMGGVIGPHDPPSDFQ